MRRYLPFLLLPVAYFGLGTTVEGTVIGLVLTAGILFMGEVVLRKARAHAHRKNAP